MPPRLLDVLFAMRDVVWKADIDELRRNNSPCLLLIAICRLPYQALRRHLIQQRSVSRLHAQVSSYCQFGIVRPLMQIENALLPLVIRIPLALPPVLFELSVKVVVHLVYVKFHLRQV